MSLYILPHTGSSLTGWSFADRVPKYDLNGEYFIFYSHGVDAEPWTFWLELQVSVKYSNNKHHRLLTQRSISELTLHSTYNSEFPLRRYFLFTVYC